MFRHASAVVVITPPHKNIIRHLCVPICVSFCVPYLVKQNYLTGQLKSSFQLIQHVNKILVKIKLRKVADRQGFEPWVGYKPTLVFKTSAFNRSAICPARSVFYIRGSFSTQFCVCLSIEK